LREFGRAMGMVYLRAMCGSDPQVALKAVACAP
jgi:hypothetical protein